MTLNFKKIPYSVLVRNWSCFLHAGWDALPLDAVLETCWLVSTSCPLPAPPGQAWCETALQPTERTGVARGSPRPCTLHRQPSTRSPRIGVAWGLPRPCTLHTHPPHAAHGHGWHGAHPGHAPSTCTLYMQPTGQAWLGAHPGHTPPWQGWHGACRGPGHAPSTHSPSRCPW